MTLSKHRVLVIGRSATALTDVVGLLRERGYAANATNQFERVLDDYDLRGVDLVLVGGMVPAELKERLRSQILQISPRAAVLAGLGGHARLLVAQVEGHFNGPASGLDYDNERRVLRIDLSQSAPVRVEALWTEFVAPDLVAHAAVLVDGHLDPATHAIQVPDEVPAAGSFLTVRIGTRVSALPIGQDGAIPASAARALAAGPLPAPEPVTTDLPWD